MHFRRSTLNKHSGRRDQGFIYDRFATVRFLIKNSHQNRDHEEMDIESTAYAIHILI